MKLKDLSVADVANLIASGMVCSGCKTAHGDITGGYSRIYMRQGHIRTPRFPCADGRVFCYPCVAEKWDREEAAFFDSLFSMEG